MAVIKKLVKMQETKRGLVRDLLDTDAAGKQLTLADFENLFVVGPKVAGGDRATLGARNR